MVTSSAESSSRRNIRIADVEPKQLPPLSVATLQNSNRKLPGGIVRHFDNNDPRYGWLLAGWLVEERRTPSGRLYRYYYDPTGRQYRIKTEVLFAWEKMGMIFIHP
ncbi:hypothetical protein CXB51_005047 [Gossypium anomalum]|uniref:MBD domain-containing protein n=1 Tax=Gossypium anomalum TaxID=47600 RepID=A0A8J5YY09_9ROSI|nr:hypothetical protein CXB51_005047 [Gossypium anomalum]